MAFYESTLVFRQDLTTPQVKEKTEKFSNIIKDLKGKVVAVENWGLRTLAYTIRKNRRAHYVFLRVDMPATAVAEYERLLRIDEDVIRFLTIVVDEFSKEQSPIMKHFSEEVQ